MSYNLHKFLKLYVSQTKKLSQVLLFTVNFFSLGPVSALNLIVLLKGPPQGL